MGYEKLREIALEYEPQKSEALQQLAAQYNRRYEREVLDLAAVAADISLNDVVNIGLEPDSDLQVIAAINRLQEDGKIPSDLSTIEEGSIQFNAIKGVYFEVLLRDELNSGRSIGDIALMPDQTARLAESTKQEGWDLQIVNSDGTLAEPLQLKASDSFSYIKKALDEHPDVRVIAPQELEEHAGNIDQLTTSNITNETMEDTVGSQLSELSEDSLTEIVHQSAEVGIDALPVLSFALVLATESGQVIAGRSTAEEALKRGAVRLGRSSVYSAIGAGLTAVDAGVISVPTIVALRVAEGRVRNRAAMGEHLEENTQEILRELQFSTV